MHVWADNDVNVSSALLLLHAGLRARGDLGECLVTCGKKMYSNTRLADRQSLEQSHGIPFAVAQSADTLLSFLRQSLQATALYRRATLVLVGYEGAGKTSLMWRLQHPDTAVAMPLVVSTDGIQTGTVLRG